jgi:hypothetical protein
MQCYDHVSSPTAVLAGGVSARINAARFVGSICQLCPVGKHQLTADGCGYCAADRTGDVHRGLYYFASTSAAVLGPFIAGLLIDALGKDYGVIFLIAPVALAFAFLFMLGVRRGEWAETVAQ